MHKAYIATIESVTPYTSSRKHFEPKLEKETPDKYDERTWRHKLTTDEKGNAVINPMAFKFALASAAKYSGEQVPTKGRKTYTQTFDSGILIVDPLPLGVNMKDVHEIKVFVNSDGKRGGGKRVVRYFPIIQHWKGQLKIHVLDQLITMDVLKKMLELAGQFIGVGQFRAERGGTNGRFKVLDLKEA